MIGFRSLDGLACAVSLGEIMTAQWAFHVSAYGVAGLQRAIDLSAFLSKRLSNPFSSQLEVTIQVRPFGKLNTL